MPLRFKPSRRAPTVTQQLTTFDANGEYGLTSVVENADQTALVNESYDADGRLLSQESGTASGAMAAYRSYAYDADGRSVATTNAVGTQTWAYDQDGKLTSTAEPTALLNAATIQYAYYPNGGRETMTVSPRGSFSYSESYAYDPLLKLKTQTFSGDSQNYTFQFARTPAGRMVSESYPNYSPETFAYDNYGRVSSITYPAAAGATATVQNGYTYDAAGEKLGYAYGSSTNAEYDYNLRGELVGTSSIPDAGFDCSLTANQIFTAADGRLVPTASGGIGNGTWDGRSGALVEPNPNCTVHGPMDPSVPITSGTTGTGTATYDVRGEMTQTLQTAPLDWTAKGGGISCSGTHTYTVTRSYDVENRTTGYGTLDHYLASENIAQCQPGAPVESGLTESYTWGPNGHPIGVSDSYSVQEASNEKNGLVVNESLHWDGDTLTFSSFSDTPAYGYSAPSPGIDRIFIGDFAVYYPSTYPQGSSLQIEPRDESGIVLAAGGIYNPNCNPGAAQVAWTAAPQQGIPFNVLVCQVRGDGYSIGANTFQGVRTYDTGSQQWTTPDAYSGDVSDPISQQRYVWNGDNPESYADPSGFSTIGTTSVGPSFSADNIESDAGFIAVGELGVIALAQQQPTPDPEPAPAPDFKCGPCAPVNNDPGHVADIILFGAGLFVPGGDEIGIGADLGKLGTVVEDPGISITSLSSHATDVMAERGITRAEMDGIVKDPALVTKQSAGQYLYLSRAGAVVLGPTGHVITTYPASWFTPEITGLLQRLGVP